MDQANTGKIDLPTLIAIAAFAYVATAFFHEGVGHGGTCVAVGGHPKAWGAYYFDCDTRGLPAWTSRLVAAAGSTVNLILCGLFTLLFNQRIRASGEKGSLTFLLWVLASINGLSWAGYFAFSGIANIGDWSSQTDGVLAGLGPTTVIAARVVMVVGGVGFYVLIARMIAGMLARLVGGDRRDRARRLAFTTYFTGGVVAVIISLANPIGLFITIASAAASSLGGTAGLFWTVRMMPRQTAAEDFELRRSWAWIALSIALVAIYAVFWGPSLNFH